MADHLRRLESLYVQMFFMLLSANVTRSFTLTPQRMRMIVEAFKDALENGLEKPEQVVVRFRLRALPFHDGWHGWPANDSDICFWMANWSRTRWLPSSWSWYVILVPVWLITPALSLTVCVMLRWNQFACLSGDPSGRRQIRDHPVQVSLDGGPKTGRWSKVIWLLCRMPQNVYRYQPCPGRWRFLAQARRGSSPWIYCKITLHFTSVRKANNTSSSHTLACKTTLLSHADPIKLYSCIVRKRSIMEFSSVGPKASGHWILRALTLPICSADLLRNTWLHYLPFKIHWLKIFAFVEGAREAHCRHQRYHWDSHCFPLCESQIQDCMYIRNRL